MIMLCNSFVVKYSCDFLCERKINYIIENHLINFKISNGKINRNKNFDVIFSEKKVDFTKFDNTFSHIISGKEIFIIYLQDKITLFKKLIDNEMKNMSLMKEKIYKIDLLLADNNVDYDKKLDETSEMMSYYLDSNNVLLENLYKKINEYNTYLDIVLSKC